MNKLFYSTILLLLSINLFAGIEPTQITNNILKANPHTKFEQNNDRLFFIDDLNHINTITKITWNGGNTGFQAHARTGLLWTDNRLYFVDNNNNLAYLTPTTFIPLTYSKTIIPTSVIAHSESDIIESTNNIYFIDVNRRVCAMGKNSLSPYIILPNSAKPAKAGTDLIWKDGKLFYIAENNKIYYFHYTNSWQFEGHVGNNLNTNANNTNLAVSTNNLYFIDNDNKVRSMGIGAIGASWWYNAPIDNTAPLAYSGSDLIWHESKLFYIADVSNDPPLKNDGFGKVNGTYIQYFYYNSSTNAWEHTQLDFIDKTSSGTTIGINSNFIEINNNILFRDWQKKILYFRSPIKLESILNSNTKPGWSLVFEDEFSSLNNTNWKLHYSYTNHPTQTNSNGNKYSWYYNVIDGSLHTPATQGTTNYLELNSTNVGAPYNVIAVPATTDINDGNYSYKSSMIHAKRTGNPATQLENRRMHGYFEIRCRIPRLNNEKFTFWLFGGSNKSTTPTNSSIYSAYEIDVFEMRGHGESFPMNYHQWKPNNNGSDAMPYQVYPVVGQNFCDGNFYTYGLEWSSDEIIWYINNQEVRRVHKDQNYPVVHIADIDLSTIVQPRIWSIDYTSEAKSPLPAFFPNTYDIDYVRVFKKCIGCRKKNSPISQNLSNEEFISIFPNPSSGIVNFSNVVEQIKVYNLRGQLIDVYFNTNRFDLNGKEKGVYLVKIQNEGKLFQEKIVIQ